MGDTLTAGLGTIDDDNDLPSTFPDDYDFQWVRGSTDIPGATSHEYTLTDDDEGHTIKVTVSFTDNDGFAESRTSAATASVAAMPSDGCTPHDLRLVGGDNDREGEVEICRNNEWRNVCDDNWQKVDADVACKQLGYTRGAQKETITLRVRA